MTSQLHDVPREVAEVDEIHAFDLDDELEVKSGYQLPPGVRLVSGANPLPVASVTRASAVTVHWQVQADSAFATHLQSVVRFLGQPAATNVAGIVIARPPPVSGSLLTQPALSRNGDAMLTCLFNPLEAAPQ